MEYPMLSVLEAMQRGVQMGQSVRQQQMAEQQMARAMQMEDLRNEMLFRSSTRPVEGGTVADTAAPPNIGNMPKELIEAATVPIRRQPKSVVKYKNAGGETLMGEMLTPEEQADRQLRMKVALERALGEVGLEKELGKISALETMREHVGVESPYMPGVKFLPSEMPRIAGPVMAAKIRAEEPKTQVVSGGEGSRLVTTKGGQLTANEPIPGTAPAKKELVPGRDIPLPPDVEAQKTRMGTATATARYSSTKEDIKDTADAIENGEAVPVLTNYSFRDRTALTAELRRRGFNQATAERDWKSIQKHLTTLNGAQQERLRQAISFAHDHLQVVDDLYKQWATKAKSSGFKAINKAALKLSSQMPGEMGALAQNLLAQINDFTSEMGTVYKGGNASTDETLRLAAGNLRADWNEQTWNKAVGLLKQSLTIRKNSINTSQPIGVSSSSPYLPPMAGKEALPGSAGPEVGTVEGGYKFRGGDPSKPDNWEKVK